MIAEENRRRGAVMIVALICLLLLLSMIGMSLVKTALAQRRQVQRQGWHLQAQWLAEAGIERAAARLAQNRNYQGESWQISAESFGGQHAGKVTIEVRRIEDRPDRRMIRVAAHFPDDPQQRAAASKRVLVDLR